ncbi:hypothetical protein N9N67_05060 [Bacteriovoracaceae bacterium]|nr:hypothetical protein [Bacteriovoracaceae bacterium]
MKSMFIIFSLLIGNLFADHHNSLLENINFDQIDHHHCKGLKISPEQKAKIKSAKMKARKEVKVLIPNFKAARKDLHATMMNPKSTRQEAAAAMVNLRKARKPIRKIKKSTKMEVLFDILDGNQRVKLIKCHKKMRRHHRRQGEHRRRRQRRKPIKIKLPSKPTSSDVKEIPQS